jgi:hypothetical protein
MNSDSAVVNSIIARGLMDPSYLQRLAANPSTELRAYSLEENARAQFAQFDWNKLYHFAGFITKVQNNQLWQTLPYTRALLKYYRIEIEVFAGYREVFLSLRAAGSAASPERVSNFHQYLAGYLAAHDQDRYPGLADIAGHERIRWEVSRALNQDAGASASPERVHIDPAKLSDLRDVVPVIQGILQIGSFRYDPAEIICLLNRGSFDSRSISERPRWVGYWADVMTKSVRLLELSQDGAAVLALIDGRRSANDIIQQFGREDDALSSSTAGIWSLIEAAQSTGLLCLVRERSA